MRASLQSFCRGKINYLMEDCTKTLDERVENELYFGGQHEQSLWKMESCPFLITLQGGKEHAVEPTSTHIPFNARIAYTVHNCLYMLTKRLAFIHYHQVSLKLRKRDVLKVACKQIVHVKKRGEILVITTTRMLPYLLKRPITLFVRFLVYASN